MKPKIRNCKVKFINDTKDVVVFFDVIYKNSKIYVAGHNGMVGSAIVRKLKFEGYTNIITKTRDELNLFNQKKVKRFFKKEKQEKNYRNS